MAANQEATMTEGSLKLLQTHDSDGKLCLKLHAALVQDILTQILSEDVNKYNCMEPEDSLTLAEEVAEFAKVSVRGAVMSRAMEQLGDLHEAFATDECMLEAVEAEISILHEEFEKLVTFSLVDRDANGVLDSREVKHMLKYIFASTFSKGSLQSVMNTVVELIHSRFNKFARGKDPRVQLGARIGAAIITSATRRWIRHGSLLSFTATIWKRIELYLNENVSDISKSMFLKMDLDGDGSVTLDEFTATWRDISRTQLRIPDVIVHLAHTIAAAIISTVIAIDSSE